MRRLPRLLVIACSLVTLVGCDHVTKNAAKSRLEYSAPRPVIGSVVRFEYAENDDIAFNLLRWVPRHVRSPMLMSFGACATLALLILLARLKHRGTIAIALTLVTAGALGNYLDRVVRGYVIDFIRVPHWPVFNVADMYVVSGILLLVLSNPHARFRNPDAP